MSPETALELQDYERPVRVTGYDDDKSTSKRCRTVSAAVAYDDPTSGEAWILKIHQAISVDGMDTNLLCPAQMRECNIRVNDEPRSLVPTPTDLTHAIHVFEDDGKTTKLNIPLSLHGIMSFFPGRKPTVEEYRRVPAERHIDLTDEDITWEPRSDEFATREIAFADGRKINRIQKTDDVERSIRATWCEVEQEIPEHQFGLALEQARMVSAVKMQRTGDRLTPDDLVKRWGISLKVAEQTIAATTHSTIRTTLSPHISRRYSTNDRPHRYNILKDVVYTDTLIAKVPSWFRGNKNAQVFGTTKGFCRAYPMKTKGEAHEGLTLFAQREGIPPTLVYDGSKEQVRGQFDKKRKKMQIRGKQIEPRSPWQNAAEDVIRELKRGTDRIMARSGAPLKLWDHALELRALIRSSTALDIFKLEGQVPHTATLGQPCDISPLAMFAFYDWLVYYDEESGFPEPKEVYGKWLGPAPDIGPAMCSKILKENGQTIYLSTYRPLNDHERTDPEQIAIRDKIRKAISDRLGKSSEGLSVFADDGDSEADERFPYQLYEDDFEGTHTHVPNIDDVTPEDADNYVGAIVTLPHDGEQVAGKVKRRAKDANGEPHGTANDIPTLDTRTYEVEFPDGHLKEYSANVIAENMYAMCDPNGNQFLMLDGIVDHRKTKEALSEKDAYVTIHGKKYPKKTTQGVDLCLSFKDGTTAWLPLADTKESYPVQVAEYAVAAGIDSEPAFRWWVKYVLKKRDKIISKVKTRYHKRTHKFGIEIPKTVAEAYALDKANGNNLWRDAIAKEMAAVRIAFAIKEPGDDVIPPGYQYMDCHMVFEVKLEGFRRKCRMVAGGHMVEAPATITYAGVVSRDTVRIALTIAALNELEVKACDIQNAYLTAPCAEKVWTTLGLEFGEDCGKKALIKRSLYGLKSAGNSFRNHLADCMRHLGYVSCKADPDLWMKPEVRPSDGFKYWAYILLYVDDALALHHDAEAELHKLDKYFKMKDGSIGDPDFYLGAKLRKVRLSNGVEAWSASPTKYCGEAVSNVEAYLGKEFGGRKFSRRCTAPWPVDYESELDVSPELTPQYAQYYQSQMGVLQWIVELGRIDMITEVSRLSSHMALPREGHLDALFHVFNFLKLHKNARMVFDPTYPEIDMKAFQEHDWTNFYGNVKEPIPTDMPEARGKSPDIRYYGDADHAGDKLSRRSRSGYHIFLNSAIIMWRSHKQPTVETAVFGSEFVSLKNGMETLRSLRYKLRMMGIPVEDPSFVYGDNMSVIHNTQRPESTLKKKSLSICYHFCRECIATGEALTAHVRTHENSSDLCTKCVPGGQLRKHLVRKVLYDIYDEL